MRERVKGATSPEIVTYLFKPAIMEDGEQIFDIMLDVDVAHVLMLGRQRIIPSSMVPEIVSGLEAIRKDGFAALPVDGAIEDLHFNIEKNLIDRTSMDTGGRMHTARSRNDLAATTTRLWLRERLTGIREALCDFRAELLALAREHAGTVMTVYTHMQPAQPITFGYYLAGLAESLERDAVRLAAAYATNNRSPLGACAVAGTSFPIDREYTAGLLGFDGVVLNSVDAVASKDHILETLSAMNMMMVNISRAACDFYIWATDEFALIEVENAIAATSSIMPQKKNPITLEHIKSKSAHVQAALVSATGVLKNTPFSHTRDASREAAHLVADACRETRTALLLFNLTLRNTIVKAEAMLEKTRKNFSTATELADVLVQDFGVSFRQAHHIVGSLVSEVAGRGLNAEDITPGMVAKSSRETAGREFALDGARLRAILDPQRNVERRTGAGNTAPADVERAVDALRQGVEKDQAALVAAKQRMADSRARMAAEIAKATGPAQ